MKKRGDYSGDAASHGQVSREGAKMYWTVAEVAALLCRDRGTIHFWIKAWRVEVVRSHHRLRLNNRAVEKLKVINAIR